MRNCRHREPSVYTQLHFILLHCSADRGLASISLIFLVGVTPACSMAGQRESGREENFKFYCPSLALPLNNLFLTFCHWSGRMLWWPVVVVLSRQVEATLQWDVGNRNGLRHPLAVTTSRTFKPPSLVKCNLRRLVAKCCCFEYKILMVLPVSWICLMD